MSRRSYSPEDQAAVYVALTVHGGNVGRTSRETGIPEQTVRNWKQKWEASGVPSEIEEASERAAEDIVERYEEVRSLAVDQLISLIKKGGANARELATIINTVDDKIVRAKGLATTRSEVVHTLPDAREVRELMRSLVQGALDGQAQREIELSDADIIDVEVVEQAPKALQGS